MPIRKLEILTGVEDYLRHELSDGTTLARMVLDRTDLKFGSFRIAAPAGMDLSRPVELSWEPAGLKGNEELLFAGVVNSYIRDPRCAVLLQETQFSMSELRRLGLTHAKSLIRHGDEVYWSVAGSEVAKLSDEGMLELINSASFYPFAAFFYVDGIPSTRGALTDDDLEHVVATLCGLAVGAFDQRSFLIWWRDDLRPFPAAD
jgi:hypothetical protein